MDRKKEINVFIGSSTVEFRDERTKLVSFIGGLNNIYRLSKGVNIEAHICENTSNEMRFGGSQKQHDDYIINEADITVFMFRKKVGKDTVHELELAKETFLENKIRPKVFVFFKKTFVSNGKIKALKAQLKGWGYHYPKFNNLDTIKLELVLCIIDLLNEKDEFDVRGGKILDIEDGKLYLINQVINGLDISNVYAYQNNSDLRDMKEKIKKLENKLSACPKGNDNEAFKISVKLTKLREEYHELEKNILDMLLFFTKERNKSGKIDPTLAQAYAYLEQGNVDAAKKLIPQKTLNSLAESIKKQRELANEILKQNEETLISRTYAMIKILAVDVKNKNRFSEIEQAYENAYETAVNRCEYDFIYDYASFLHDQNDYDKAVHIAEKLRYLYSNPDRVIPAKDQASLLNLLGMLYRNVNKFSEAEEVYNTALKIMQNEYEVDKNSVNEANIATTCNNLAMLYSDTNRFDDAEKLYKEALSTYRRLAKDVSLDAYEPYVADTCNNLAVLYCKTNRFDDAEKLYEEALKMRRRLAKDVSRDAYEPGVADTCNNLAVLYKDTNRLAEAEELYKEALKMRRRLAKEVSRDAYEPKVANTCNNLAVLYCKTNRFDDAEKLYEEALSIYRRLAIEVSRDAYESDVADACNNLALLYYNTNRLADAEKLYEEALSIYRRLAKEVSRDAYEPKVANTCNNFAALYSNTNRLAEAEELYKEALSIYRRLAKEVSRDAYELNVAKLLYNLGLLFKATNCIDEAEKYFAEAKSLTEKIQKR